MDTFFLVDPQRLRIEAMHGYACRILSNAIRRYSELIKAMKKNKSKRANRINSRAVWENSIPFQVSAHAVAVVHNECKPKCQYTS